MAAALLQRGMLKAFDSNGFLFGSNTIHLLPFMKNRGLAERIMASVPFIRIPVYEMVTPPLTDRSERELEDWELEFEDWHMRPMPENEPHLPARVIAFTSQPWGRVGLFLVLFDDTELLPVWGMWYLRQPSAKTGTNSPFFRLGDYDDAQLLMWMVLKPYLKEQGIIVENVAPPETDYPLGPWHRVRDVLRFKEMPEWFIEALNKTESCE